MVTRSSRLFGPIGTASATTTLDLVLARADTYIVKSLAITWDTGLNITIEVLLNGTATSNRIFYGQILGPRSLYLDTWIVLEPADVLRLKRSGLGGGMLTATGFGTILPGG